VTFPPNANARSNLPIFAGNDDFAEDRLARHHCRIDVGAAKAGVLRKRLSQFAEIADTGRVCGPQGSGKGK
jgi:hypothetical protein